MTAVKVRFDGHQIEVPPALRSAAPVEVLIVYDESHLERIATPPADGPSSIWDVFGKAPVLKDAAELDARLRAEREEWDDER